LILISIKLYQCLESDPTIRNGNQDHLEKSKKKKSKKKNRNTKLCQIRKNNLKQSCRRRIVIGRNKSCSVLLLILETKPTEEVLDARIVHDFYLDYHLPKWRRNASSK
jgi:hypothetical protein